MAYKKPISRYRKQLEINLAKQAKLKEQIRKVNSKIRDLKKFIYSYSPKYGGIRIHNHLKYLEEVVFHLTGEHVMNTSPRRGRVRETLYFARGMFIKYAVENGYTYKDAMKIIGKCGYSGLRRTRSLFTQRLANDKNVKELWENLKRSMQERDY